MTDISYHMRPMEDILYAIIYADKYAQVNIIYNNILLNKQILFFWRIRKSDFYVRL